MRCLFNCALTFVFRSPGDVLCEVQTDKAIVAMEHDDEAVMAKIVRLESSGEIDVGEVIAVVAESGEDWKEVQVASLRAFPEPLCIIQ